MPVGKVHDLKCEVLELGMLGVAAVVDEAVAAIRHCMPPQAAVGPPLRSLSRLLDPVDLMQLGELICTDATCATFDFFFFERQDRLFGP